MPPQLALLLTTGFVLYLFRTEARRNASFPRELWVPVVWFLLAGSRFASQWFGVLTGSGSGGISASDGSPIDAVVFLVLILLGIRTLARRQVTLASALRVNLWITLFFAYGLTAVLWSDDPFVALKRWIKVTGHPIMALVVVTSPDPAGAFRGLLKRIAFILVPASVLLIKYYPHIGRGFDPWEGAATNNGVSLSKNELGGLSVIFTVFLFWNLLEARRITGRKERRQELLQTAVVLVPALWLLVTAHSATALVCTAAGVCTIPALQTRWVRPQRLGTWVLAGALAYVILEPILGIYTSVIQMLGRDPNLTDRTEVWADALALVDNPVLGAGFESFWLGSRLDILWEKWWWRPNQAHNGYLETYLNLGIIGTVLFAGMVYSAFRVAQRNLCAGVPSARLHLALLAVILLFNFTEATFKAVSPLWTLFCITALATPRKVVQPGVRGLPHRPHFPVPASGTCNP